jgi:2-dehydro-3-deoxyphosphooctonate aldolase (KDO 8-P synthase)
MRPVELAEGVTFGGPALGLISGPCVIESRDHCLRLAEAIAREARAVGFPFVFKASYDKANRTSGASFRGPGVDEGLAILAAVRSEVGVPVLTDIHSPEQAAVAGEVVDVLQIPAFLCRQTDLIVAAAATGLPVNVKKGQFLAPWDMANVTDKAAESGNRRLLVTERGVSFGYNNLVVDIRGLCVLAEQGYPVVLDVTHSLQLPGGEGHRTGGQPEFAAPLAAAGVAAGVDALFVEAHDDPPRALSDATTQLPLAQLPSLLRRVARIREATVAGDHDD